MESIPLPTGLKGDSDTPKQLEIVVNAYLEKGDKPTLSPRPGIEQIGFIYGRCRGQGPFNDAVYRVAADKVFKFTFRDSGELVIDEVAGTIEGNADCKLVQSFGKLFIIAKGGKGYVIDAGNDLVLTQVIDPILNLSGINDVAFLDGRFVIIPSDGDKLIRWSEINNPTSWPSENFSDAEVAPDKSQHIIEYSGTLLVGGSSTIEQLTYDSQKNIYTNTTDAALNHGVVSDFARWGESIVYIGKYERGQMAVYQYGNPNPISSKYVDEVLRKYTVSELRDVLVDTFVWKGQPMVTWRLPNETICYYGDFAVFKSGVSGDFTGQWFGQYVASLQGRLICGDSISPRVGEFKLTNSDYGAKVESFVRTYIRGDARNNFPVKRIACSITTGQTNEEKSIGLSVSPDGVHNYDAVVYRSLGKAGIYSNEISFSPIGRFDNFCGIQLTWACNIKVPLDGVYFE
jgi:hypothetical protein